MAFLAFMFVSCTLPFENFEKHTKHVFVSFDGASCIYALLSVNIGLELLVVSAFCFLVSAIA